MQFPRLSSQDIASPLPQIAATPEAEMCHARPFLCRSSCNSRTHPLTLSMLSLSLPLSHSLTHTHTRTHTHTHTHTHARARTSSHFGAPPPPASTTCLKASQDLPFPDVHAMSFVSIIALRRPSRHSKAKPSLHTAHARLSFLIGRWRCSILPTTTSKGRAHLGVRLSWSASPGHARKCLSSTKLIQKLCFVLSCSYREFLVFFIIIVFVRNNLWPPWCCSLGGPPIN